VWQVEQHQGFARQLGQVDGRAAGQAVPAGTSACAGTEATTSRVTVG